MHSLFQEKQYVPVLCVHLGIYFKIAHGVDCQMSYRPVCKVSWSQEKGLA